MATGTTATTDSLPSDPRSFHLMPDWIVIGLLFAECLLWLSELFGWPEWNKGYAVLAGVAFVGVAIALGLFCFSLSSACRQFKFRTYSVCTIVCVVVVTFSRFALQLAEAKQQEQVIEQINRSGVMAFYWDGEKSNAITNGEESPQWLRKLLGDGFFDKANGLSFLDPVDAELEMLKEWPHLKILNLTNLFPDRKHSHFVDDLVLRQVTDAGLRHLSGLRQLEYLSLCCPKVTNVGLEHLTELHQLKDLELYLPEVTDAGLKSIGKLSQLRKLKLYYTRLSEGGIKKLQQELPNCKIERKAN
jgi:hypothetical protein